MCYLVVDLETTGLHPTSYIVSIAWIVLNDALEEVQRAYYVVQPDGYEIPKESVRVHGITTEKAKKEGIPIRHICYKLGRAIFKHQCATLVSHNINFDRTILIHQVSESFQRILARKIMSLKTFCTMKKGAQYMGVKKWPKLTLLYKHLFDVDIANEEQHHALFDCQNCAAIFKKLRERNNGRFVHTPANEFCNTWVTEDN